MRPVQWLKYKIIDEEVPAAKPSPYARRWWSKELTDLKQEKNCLSNLALEFCGLPNTPIHTLHKQACNKYCNRIEETKKAHWKNWLEDVSPKDVYIANKYMTSPHSDFSNVRMPALKFTCDGTNLSAIINTNKVEALASTFFPPPLATTYPKPFETQGYFTRNNIHNTIKKLKPFKAPEADGIQNIVIQKCTETIIDHLYFIFHAILELDTYPH